MPKSVLIASESPYRRTLLSEMLSSDKGIIVVDLARNEQEASNAIINKNPDILILDIEYKNKEWHSPFNFIIKQFNITTIVLTDIDPNKTDSLDIPLVLKFYDYIVKPEGIWKDVIPTIKDKLISKVILADIGKINKIDNKIRLISKNLFIQQSQKVKFKPKVISNKVLDDSVEQRSEDYFLDLSPITIKKVPTKIIVIGASVGGPRTLRTILSDIPQNFPAPVLVVQHLNHLFMRQFATSLKNICKATVKIGMNNEEIKAGTIYLSPGDKHMQVIVKDDKPCIRTYEGEPVNFCRPSVDVLFYSTARVYKEKALGILLTGMGADGASGLKAIKQEGGRTIAESEETSILYGMPKAAAETGAADLILPNYKIVDEIIKFTT
ncbi:MAG: chemotaxis protein CheB [Candidatus Hermodarchaeota archaeon]